MEKKCPKCKIKWGNPEMLSGLCFNCNYDELDEVRALSWKQPYASLMLHGKIETRSWNTNYRGKVLICASKTPYNYNDIMAISGERQGQRVLNYMNSQKIEQPNGVAIAIGELVDCRPMEPKDKLLTFVEYVSPWMSMRERKNGQIHWVEKQLWCHIYKNVQPIEPFEWKGTQGWKILDEETKAKIKI